MRQYDNRALALGRTGRLVKLQRIVSLVALLCVLQFLHACVSAPELIGVDNPNVPVGSVPGAKLRKIFLATTRETTETQGALFSAERAPELGLASVHVSIPPNHVVGNLERPKKLPPDPRKEFAIVNPTIYTSDDAFVSAMNEALSQLPVGKRDVLFFVHGYNNTTSDATLRLAQFVEDSGFEGIALLFDWASAAQLTRYVYDLNSALIARPQLLKLAMLMNRTKAEGYNIFAHSMGAFLTMEAMVDFVQQGKANRNGRLKSIILASPDIDIDLFRSQLKLINRDMNGFYVLLSKDDAALKVSRRLAGGVPRVGAANADELASLGVVAIDLSRVDDSASGSHSKFAGSPEVVKLLGVGLNSHGRFGKTTPATSLDQFLLNTPIRVVN